MSLPPETNLWTAAELMLWLNMILQFSISQLQEACMTAVKFEIIIL